MLTVGWGLTVMTTMICEVIAAVAMLIARWRMPAPWMETLAGTMLFAAVVTGAIGVALTMVVATARNTPAPRRLLIFAWIVSVAPLLIAIERLSR